MSTNQKFDAELQIFKTAMTAGITATTAVEQWRKLQQEDVRPVVATPSPLYAVQLQYRSDEGDERWAVTTSLGYPNLDLYTSIDDAKKRAEDFKKEFPDSIYRILATKVRA